MPNRDEDSLVEVGRNPRSSDLSVDLGRAQDTFSLIKTEIGRRLPSCTVLHINIKITFENIFRTSVQILQWIPAKPSY
jgi:hypothetical protein